jgi:hypothetical protein
VILGGLGFAATPIDFSNLHLRAKAGFGTQALLTNGRLVGLNPGTDTGPDTQVTTTPGTRLLQHVAHWIQRSSDALGGPFKGADFLNPRNQVLR